MRVANWNVNSVKARLNHVIDFLKDESPDILLLQELKCEEISFPYEAFEHLGYNIYVNGEKTYNGVAIFSKYIADEKYLNFDLNPIPEQARFIECKMQTEIGYLSITSLYAPNGGEVDSIKYINKLKFYDQYINYLTNNYSDKDPIIIGGDFNIAPFDDDVYDKNVMKDQTCFTEPEKTKLRTILNNNYLDLYRLNNPNSKDFTWWDYRGGSFEQNKGMRIDFILANPVAANFNKNFIIESKYRSRTKPSDHAPIVADFKK